MAKGDFGGKRNIAGFNKNPENINKNGRPKKSISSVNAELKEKGYEIATKTQIVDCYLTLINLDLVELKALVEDKKQPAMVRIVGKAIMSGKGFDVVEKVLDRGIGKALQTNDYTTKGESLNDGPTQINFIKRKEDDE